MEGARDYSSALQIRVPVGFLPFTGIPRRVDSRDLSGSRLSDSTATLRRSPERSTYLNSFRVERRICGRQRGCPQMWTAAA